MDLKEGKQGREEGRVSGEEDGNGWMDGVAGGRGIVMPDTTHDGMGRREGGTGKTISIQAEVLT